MMLEEINDQLDAQNRAKAATIPVSEDAYASMLAQFEKAQGRNKGKMPKPNFMEHKAECNANQQKVLDLLAEHGPMKRAHIAELMGVSPSSVSDYAKRLRFLGLVYTSNMKTDKALYHLVEKETE